MPTDEQLHNATQAAIKAREDARELRMEMDRLRAERDELLADKARLDWLDMRARVTWSAAEKDPMDMRLTPIRQAIDDQK